MLVCYTDIHNTFWPWGHYYLAIELNYTLIQQLNNNVRLNVCVYVFSCSFVSDSLWPHGLHHARLLHPWDFPGKNARVGCHFLLQGIFLTQGLNLCLLDWLTDSLPLSHLGSPNNSVGYIISCMKWQTSTFFQITRHLRQFLLYIRLLILILAYEKILTTDEDSKCYRRSLNKHQDINESLPKAKSLKTSP